MNRGGGHRTVRLSLFLAIAAVFAACSTVGYEELAEEYFNLGNAYFDAGDFERSYRYYTRALEYSNDLPAAGFNLARLHIERDEPDDALAIVDLLLAEDPENTLYLETRAYALLQLDRPDDARVLYRNLLSERIVRPRIAYNLALLELESGETTVAREILDAGAAFATDDHEYAWLHAEAAYDDGAEEEAITHLERFGFLVSGDANEAQQLARLVRRYAAWEFNLAALDLLEQFEPDAEDQPEIAFLRGTLLLRATDDFDGGLAAVEDAIAQGFRERDRYEELLEVLADEEAAIIIDLAANYDFVIGRGSPEESASDVLNGVTEDADTDDTGIDDTDGSDAEGL